MNGASPVLPVHPLDIVAARKNPSLILAESGAMFAPDPYSLADMQRARNVNL
jgi:hypothetical protein